MRLRLILFLTWALAGAAAPPDSQAQPARQQSLAPGANLDAVVRANAAAGFSGVVLVARGDEMMLFEGVGVDRDARFWIASTGKQFVSAAILRLAGEGRVGLDDPIGRFFPAAPPDKAAITIRQLLSHTSGLGQSYVSEQQSDRAVAVERMLAEPLAGAPGGGFRYSNSNLQLAAAIVEIVSGTSYDAFLRRHFLDPLGLRATGFAGDAGAASVHPIAGDLPPRLRRSFWGEQGVYSSAQDLFRWYRALRSGRVLAPAQVETLFNPVVRIGEGHAALGWFTGASPSARPLIFVRGNEDFGANSLLYAYPEQDIVIIVLTHAGNASEELSWSRKVHRELEAALRL